MRAIWRIARTELQLMFYSPIAWFLLLFFVIATAVYFVGTMQGFIQEMEISGRNYWLSSRMFVIGEGARSGLWFLVVGYLYLLVPLLTMGVFSQELSNGSIKLLYSSPISNAHIVLGKYLAMVVFALVLVGVMLVYTIVAGCLMENFEWGWILTGVLGIFLLTCTYMAVGIFVSSLTRYQVIAAVGIFIMLFVLNWVSGLWQQFDVVRDITYWLGLNDRAGNFISGLICSEDVIYFPVIIAMFLTWTIIRLHAIRQKEQWSVTLWKNVGVIVIVGVIAFVSSRPSLMGYIDTTSNKQNTLTPVSQEIIGRVDGGLTITTYVNLLDPGYGAYAYPNFIMKNREEFKKFTRFKPETKLKVVYYYALPKVVNPTPQQDEMAWQQARGLCEVYELDSTMFLSRKEVDELADLKSEGYRFMREAVRDNGQREWIRPYQGDRFMEDVTSVALKRMIEPSPVIGYLTGHRERSMYGDVPYDLGFIMSNKWNMNALCSMGFDVKEMTFEERIPDEVSLLWIADPRDAFTPEEETVLQDYIDRGGNMVYMGEYRHRDAQNPFLTKMLGLELTPLIVGPDTRFKGALPRMDVIAAMPNPIAEEKMWQLKNTYTVAHEGAAGVEQVEDKGFEVFPVVTCDTMGMYWTELETTDFVDDTARYNPAAGEVAKLFNTVVGLERERNGKEQKIMVFGDASCLTNNEFIITRGVSASNGQVMLGCANWMSDGKLPLDVRRADTNDKVVHMDMSGFTYLRFFILYLFPVLVAALGVFMYVRRRGR